MNPQPNSNQNGGRRQSFQRRNQPFQKREGPFQRRRTFTHSMQTRTLRSDSPSSQNLPSQNANALTTNQQPTNQSHGVRGSSIARHPHRIVMGRGARNMLVNKAIHSGFGSGTGQHGTFHQRSSPTKHIAGARMNIVRKASVKMGRPGPAGRRPAAKREEDIIPPLQVGAIRIIPMGGVE